MTDSKPMTTDEMISLIVKAKRREDVVAPYAQCLLDIDSVEAAVDWPSVNRAIMRRWTEAALLYIKRRAWAMAEKPRVEQSYGE